MSDMFEHEDSPQSEGGRARANLLPPERGKEIARKAAAVRWETPGDEMPWAICGSTDQTMRIPSLGVEILCYVIEGERRVLVQRGMVEALGMARGSAGSGGDRLANFVAGDCIKPFVPSSLQAVIVEPIKFRAPNGL